MKFHIKKVILWLNNKKIREIKFEPNKVNVITGDSSTGKTEILDIIDYCFFSSDSKISESIVNENIAWYGILLHINGREYTIARKSLIKGAVSKEYYFSSEGEIPDSLVSNNSEVSIKSLMESEFRINSDVSIPYGSNLIKPGSKISIRYFLMFNTISVNIIENDTGVFFDKQNNSRYRDALPRIFDLAVGIETTENVLKKEKKAELELKLSKLQRKSKSISSKSDSFRVEQESMIKEAKEYSLISPELDFDSSLSQLELTVSGIQTEIADNGSNSELEHDVYLKERKIKNLKRFVSEFQSYKNSLSITNDSLKPITFLKERDADLIKTSIFSDVIGLLAGELNEIRNACKTKTPIDKQVNDEIKKLEKELSVLKNSLSIMPDQHKNFNNDKERYFFLGSVKSKMELYSLQEDSLSTNTDKEIERLRERIGAIDVVDTIGKRDLTIKVIEEIISEYMKITGEALVNYSSYQPVFDYKEKSLLLRKPKTTFIENVGSSSNHMFLHLFFTLAMQEIAFRNESPFVAPYIVIDQPSRPYWGSGDEKKETLNKSDTFKIRKVFELMDSFIKSRNENSGDFQMIVFEHIPRDIFENLANIHLVEEFKDGNALIPNSMLDDLK
tara:strand:+ start:4181 stop:6031 length:1851 start_codon:yes stop_codon:yes gene_type:complete